MSGVTDVTSFTVLSKSLTVDSGNVSRMEVNELVGVSVTTVAFVVLSEVIIVVVVAVVAIFVVNVVVPFVAVIVTDASCDDDLCCIEDVTCIREDWSKEEPDGCEMAIEDFFVVSISLREEYIELLSNNEGDTLVIVGSRNVNKLLPVTVIEAEPAVTRREMIKVSVDDKTVALVNNTCLLTLLVLKEYAVNTSFSEETLKEEADE